MPRGRKPGETPEKLEQNRAMWDIFGKKAKITVASWDPKSQLVMEAILEVLATGSTVVLRPGTGAGSVGVAIWERKLMHDPVWCNTESELDAWAGMVLDALRADEAAD